MSGPDSGEEARLVDFAAAPSDMVEDLCGDPGADLAVFFAGNQYMAVSDLVQSFLVARPSISSVFYETLPPGVVAAQLRAGGAVRGDRRRIARGGT